MSFVIAARRFFPVMTAALLLPHNSQQQTHLHCRLNCASSKHASLCTPKRAASQRDTKWRTMAPPLSMPPHNPNRFATRLGQAIRISARGFANSVFLITQRLASSSSVQTRLGVSIRTKVRVFVESARSAGVHLPAPVTSGPLIGFPILHPRNRSSDVSLRLVFVQVILNQPIGAESTQQLAEEEESSCAEKCAGGCLVCYYCLVCLQCVLGCLEIFSACA